MSEEGIILRLEEILEIVKRIEARQIEVKAEIEAGPVEGSFASTDPVKS